MRFKKRGVAGFFGPSSTHETITGERREWIAKNPDRYLAMMQEGVDLLDETIGMATELGTMPEGICADSFSGLDPMARCRLLAEHWEPDFLLMRPDADGVFRLRGGGLCFPSHWDLREKLGRSMAEIHSPVPDLNATLGKQIDGFLRLIKPGISWERENWGLSRSPELNLHPSRKLPLLDGNVTLEEVWFRLEKQSLVALAESGGILFGIRVMVFPLHQIRDDPASCRGLARALVSMPEGMARYKGIASAREALIEALKFG